ncbi:MAG: ABC transporter permease subunit [Planctomycetaceae bacterium]
MAVWNFVSRIELPLLKRELIEAAQRRRTYILRVAVLAVFALFFLVTFASLAHRIRSPLRMMGSGRELTEVLFAVMASALYALLPAMACSSITSEKEKQTLGLLLTSRLTPAIIVLEKIASRVMPMLSLIVVAAPLLGVAYLMGGVSFSMTAIGLLILVFIAIHITAIAVCCSALLESSLAAFWATYGVLLTLSFGWPVLIGRGPFSGLPDNELFLAAFYPLALLLDAGRDAGTVMLFTIPANIVTLIAIVVARVGLVRYSFGQPLPVKKWLLNTIRVLKRALKKVLASLPLAHPLHRFIPDDAQRESKSDLPDLDPVAWRERRRSIIHRRSTVAGFVGLQILVQWCWFAASSWIPYRTEEISAIVSIGLLIIALLIVMGYGCRSFAGEREKQTLDSLLTMPLRNRDLLRQKLAGVNRLSWLLLFPIAVAGVMNLAFTNGLMKYWVEIGIMPRAVFSNIPRAPVTAVPGVSWLTHTMSATRFLFAAAATAFVYMHFVKWISVWFGLRFQSQMKAMLGSLLTVIALCIVPALIAALIMISMDKNPDDFPIFCFMSPAIIPCFNEIHELHMVFRRSWFPDSEWLVVLTNLAAYGSLVLALRWYVLRNLHNLMNRSDAVVCDRGRPREIIPEVVPEAV